MEMDEMISSHLQEMRNFKMFEFSTNIPDFRVFYLFDDHCKPPNIVIIFWGNRILITGENIPNNRGMISDPGASLEWYLKASDEQLASHFLELEYFPEMARRDLRDYLRELENDGEIWSDQEVIRQFEQMNQVIQENGDFMFDTPEILRSNLIQFFPGEPLIFGFEYSKEDQSFLLAIQRKFIQLFIQKEPLS